MNKNFLIIPSVAIVLIITAAGVNAALAEESGRESVRGGHFGSFGVGCGGPAMSSDAWDNSLQKQADALSITIAEMKDYWAQGMTFKEVASLKGINQKDLEVKMKATRLAEQQAWLQSMVVVGKLTQAQADTRLKFMTDRLNKEAEGRSKKLGNMGNRCWRNIGDGFDADK